MARRRGQRCPIHKTATGWMFRYRVDSIDGARRGLVKHLNVKGKREAEKLRDEFLASINKPEILIPVQACFGSILDRFVDSLGVDDSSAASYTSAVNKHIRPRWGDVRMCDIEQMDVEAWLGTISRECSLQLFKKIKSVFRLAWMAAIRWGFTRQAEPISLAPRNIGKTKPGRQQSLPTEDEMNLLLAALSIPERNIVQVMMFTGMRVSEAMALRWRDLETDTLKVSRAAKQRTNEVFEKLKGRGSKRVVPVADLRAMLHRPPGAAREDLIYTEGDYWHLQACLKAAAEKAGCNYVGFGCHAFRRWHNTMFRLEEGGSPELAMAQLGHLSREVNDVYMLDPQTGQRAAIVKRMVSRFTEVPKERVM